MSRKYPVPQSEEQALEICVFIGATKRAIGKNEAMAYPFVQAARALKRDLKRDVKRVAFYCLERKLDPYGFIAKALGMPLERADAEKK